MTTANIPQRSYYFAGEPVTKNALFDQNFDKPADKPNKSIACSFYRFNLKNS